ncbi:30S ribosomal protein S5 [Candidatus Shapirobacteria bacterium RIFOXYD1_FULL_38_32]|jgi:small subunit ribosomal protein S5|uniref:Small ribosomal subunit protein uS5 n=3 Tax=Candidatus Shapironibacteriota TaxID=1752721 RepID=A0A0G0K3L7_9BACT|nr:MAG: 30S ribosomal protein S5 [Candidatus Shapirobacteria bacterium GW2011_GWE2_38_30]KKQ91429.1 MAG: 30S ribosomal protein S5 [Candidatus Shapirobacteria bacterium GW2011_GWE1_38_92]OGL55877.1 MAG: 30S ribosomal protein S5 [Candidatus Shapirobacteria bacterium RIFOXYA1_FULL_39_17]OGL57124.1 MAG: 30S ribosomal protein S5 [Candidatus Shapirobacteria bacterium RIFOXYD1_FULL_38_32]OGL57461.1 MAG: 30S ribosomal protein S5 [Candidatus Shapirobacteria bacterium RIFOXYB1_FULL_38_38]HAP37774.1 30S 
MAYQQSYRNDKPESEFIDKVVEIKRVSNKTKGGNQISFTALVVSGDKKSKVGVGLGKAKSVADAIQKGIKKSHKSMLEVPIVDGTIPHQVKVKFKGAIVLIRPGKQGSGLIAGGPVRSVVEVAGVKDIASKIIGSKNKSINVWATLKALTMLKK